MAKTVADPEAEKKAENERLNKDIVASAERITELRRGRNLDEIPLNDEYWKALQKHQAAHSRND